jgi:hypothetical protein
VLTREIFELATKGVSPKAGALGRQLERQRQSERVGEEDLPKPSQCSALGCESDVEIGSSKTP